MSAADLHCRDEPFRTRDIDRCWCTAHWIKEFAVRQSESYARRAVLSLAHMLLNATELHQIIGNGGLRVDDQKPYGLRLD